MCYYQLKLYMLCGHGEHSKEPLKKGPLCPLKAKAQCLTPETGSPISTISPIQSIPTQDESQKENSDLEQSSKAECKIKKVHPLHTYRVESLCPACNQERWQRIAKFEVGVIKDGVNRGFIKERQKDRVEIQGKWLRTLRTGYQAGKASEQEADKTVLHDTDSMISLGGQTLKEEGTPEKANVTSSGRNSLGNASSLRRRSTFISNGEAAGSVYAVESERAPGMSMATRAQAVFNA